MNEPQFLITEESLRERMKSVWNKVCVGVELGPVLVTLSRPKRSGDQNRKLWAMLSDVSRQVEWYGQNLSQDDWKNVFTAALTKQRAVPGIDGGFVVLGSSTSKMNKKQFSDLIEIIYAFGAENNVEWSDTSMEGFDRERC